METALSSSSILHAPSFSYKLSNGDKNRFYRYSATPKNNFNILPPFSSTLPLCSNFPGKILRFTRFSAFRLPSSIHDQKTSQEFAVLLEVEGVLMDAYRGGDRHAFNSAFQKLGLDCANWSEPVYADVLRRSTGDEEKMLLLYFNRIGWPTSLSTSEKGEFIKSVLQEKLYR